MKIAHFADLHLDAPFRWAGPDAGRQLRDRIRQTLRNVVDVALEQDVDAVFCGGDLYEHDFLTPDTESFLVRAFADLGDIPVLLAPGNHDYFSPESAYARADWSENVHLFTENRLEPFDLQDGVTVWGAAHLVPANTPGFLDDFSVDRDGINLALFHGSERGWFTDQEDGKQPHAPFDLAQIGEAGIDHLFSGHFHQPKTKPLLTYPGNPHPLSFGESGERGLVIATVSDDGHISRETIGVSPTDSHDIRVDITGLGHRDAIRDQIESQLSSLSGIARVTIKGELAPEVDFRLTDFDDVAAHLDAVVVRSGDLTPGYDLDQIATEETVRGEFVRAVSNADLPSVDRDLILTIGLRALQGRDDLAVV